MNNSDILIIGIGNEYRGDDAAGLLAARKLRNYDLKGIEVIENNGDGAELINKWTGRKKVILIDAVQSTNFQLQAQFCRQNFLSSPLICSAYRKLYIFQPHLVISRKN